jgi:phospholipid/cholesterol/gamma-HCH transport system permease protein
VSSTQATTARPLAVFVQPLVALGEATIDWLTQLGLACQFIAAVFVQIVKPPFRWKLILQQCEFVGVGSLFIIGLTGSFTGAIFTLETVNGLAQFNLENVVGTTVMLGVARELAPVLTALMVTGRVASAMATELGTMNVTEQIDAMEVMAVDPVHYLVKPRVIAAAFMVPALSIIFVAVAFAGSYIIAVPVLSIDEGAYLSRIRLYIDAYDYLHGFYKAIVFGILLSLIGCYKGYFASGGARGVGVATTQAVVVSSITIFVVDYVLTSLLIKLETARDLVTR